MKYRLAAIPKTAMIVVLGIFISGGQLNCKACLVIALSCLLWTVLYGLNEATDFLLEAKRLENFWAMPLCLTLSILCIAGGYLTGGYLIGSLLFLMAFSQVIYCWPGLRTKRFVWAGPLQSGFLNPALRFSLGLSLGINPTTSPNIVLICFTLLIALHLAGAIKTRVYQTSRDRQLGYQTFPLAFVTRYIEPLQFITPVCAGGLMFVSREAQGTIFLPVIVQPIVVFVSMIGILTIWAINDVYDRARHQLAALIVHNYGGSLDQAELSAGIKIVDLEMEAGVPSIELLRDLWHLKVPVKLIVPGPLLLVILASFFLPILPMELAVLSVTVILTVYRATTRPQY